MSNKPPIATMELEDRDPNNLSGHLQVAWDDVIGEPEGVRSPECAWMVSHNCFRITKNCCYIGLSVICAPVTAFFLGIAFACLSFQIATVLLTCLLPAIIVVITFAILIFEYGKEMEQKINKL